MRSLSYITLFLMAISGFATPSIQYSQIRRVPIADLTPLNNVFSIVNEDSTYIELVTPPVGNQDTVYNCIGWSMCYANASIICYSKTQDWATALRSPSYNFNRVKECHAGTGNHWKTTGSILGFDMARSGVPSYKLFPATLDVSKTPNAIHSAAASLTKFEYTRLNDLTYIEEYKSILRKGYPISVVAEKGVSFEQMWHTGCIWNSIDVTDTASHMTTIIGYDDSAQLFKVMNSYGTSNAGNGFYWVTYNNVRNGCYKEGYVLDIDCFGNIDIVGPSGVCDNTYYYVSNLPNSVSVSWGKSSNWFATTTCVDDTTAIYSRSASNTAAEVSLNAIRPPISSQNCINALLRMGEDTLTIKKNIELPSRSEPVINRSKNSENEDTFTVYAGSYATFTETAFPAIADSALEWTFSFFPLASTIAETTTIAYGHSVRYKPRKIGRLQVAVRRLVPCPENSYSEKSFIVLYNMHMVSVSTEGISFEAEEGVYDVMIMDIQGNCLSRQTCYGPNFTISTERVRNRSYIIHISQNGLSLWHQVMPPML